MSRWRWIGLAIGLALASAACNGGATPEVACAHVCECLHFLPSEQRECAPECEPVLASAPPECLDCFAAVDCRELEVDPCSQECPAFTQELAGGAAPRR
jgi:hypothetical protein